MIECANCGHEVVNEPGTERYFHRFEILGNKWTGTRCQVPGCVCRDPKPKE